MSFLQKILFGLYLILVTAYSSYEIIDELKDLESNQETLMHVSSEIVLVLASFCALLYFSYYIYSQHKSRVQLEKSLQEVKKNLEGANIRLQQGKKEYFETIQWQFKEWLLSPSEAQIALLMLKGLSIKEIAKARSTHDRTVRKQASAIYEKSNLAGRHELSAWFIEDMLSSSNY
jgi:DNA-binding NarL/FixJ family response regulator